MRNTIIDTIKNLINPEDENILTSFIKEGRVIDPDLVNYLKKINSDKIFNKFMDSELLVQIMERLDRLSIEERATFGNNIDEIIDNLYNFYLKLAPITGETVDYEKVLQIFLLTITKENLSHYTVFDKELYDVITDKNSYAVIINKIINSKILIKEIPRIKEYILDNREYFNSDNFLPHVIKTLNIVEKRGEFSNELMNKLKVENKKNIGIYDIDEETLANMANKLNDSNSAYNLLSTALKSAKILMQNFDLKKEEFEEYINSILVTFQTKANNILDQAILNLTKKYNEYLGIEKSKLVQEREKEVRFLKDKLAEDARTLRAIGQSIETNSQHEIERIRNESQIALDKLKELLGSSPELKEVLDSFKGSLDIASMIGELKEFLKTTGGANLSDTISQIKGNVFLKKEQEIEKPIPKVVIYLDNSIKYSERYKKAMDRWAFLKEQGNKYHYNFEQVLVEALMGANIYLCGPSGTGKSHIARQLAELLELEYYDLMRINESYDVTGTVNIHGEYNKPLFFQAFKYGGIAMADELDGIHPNTAIIFNHLIDGIKETYFPHNKGKVIRHPNFRFVSAGNTVGTGANQDYQGRYAIDRSVTERLVTIPIGYDENLDNVILGSCAGWTEFTDAFKYVAPGLFTTRQAVQILPRLKENAYQDKNKTLYHALEYQVARTLSPTELGRVQKNLKDYASDKSFSKEALNILNVFNTLPGFDPEGRETKVRTYTR